MSSQSTAAAETIETRGCRIVLRRVIGPVATELFFRCEPVGGAMDAGGQAEAMYRAILGVLHAEADHDSTASVITETLVAGCGSLLPLKSALTIISAMVLSAATASPGMQPRKANGSNVK